MVWRGLPFQRTSEPGTNPDPFTVSVNAGPPTSAEVGLIVLIRGSGLALGVIVNVDAFDSPPPGEGLNTVTAAEPTAAIYVAVI